MDILVWAPLWLPFQSCNRGSFLFKAKCPSLRSQRILFQSRNRGSFLFKAGRINLPPFSLSSFNLVIEVLFFSRPSPARRKPWSPTSFNLVIEVLFFSSRWTWWHGRAGLEFQSRNRGSFLFKGFACLRATGFFAFQSRNRGSFLFKGVEPRQAPMYRCYRFNLVIEVLFFSSGLTQQRCPLSYHQVSIS